jgi:hypothetical protein
MHVAIIEKKLGKQIGIFPIQLGGSLGQSETEYFDEAWRCAVEDGFVNANERTAYIFKLIAS